MNNEHLSDKEQIFSVHERWRKSQIGWNTELMKSCKAKGNHFLQYNLNGQIYRSSEALASLWEQMGSHVELIESEDLADINITIKDDLAILLCDHGVMRFRAPEELTIDTGVWSMTFEKEGTEVYFRTTEIYRKDDGEGNPEWRMWHAHYQRVTSEPSKP